MSGQRVGEVKRIAAGGADDVAQEVGDGCGHTVEATSTGELHDALAGAVHWGFNRASGVGIDVESVRMRSPRPGGAGAAWSACGGRVRVPRIEAQHIERLEVPDVSRRYRHTFGLRDGGDERVIEGCGLGNPVGREDARSWQVKWQDAVGKRGQELTRAGRAPRTSDARSPPEQCPNAPWR